ncbi:MULTISPECIES: acyl-CoA dehydrogenase family protein [Candidatus Microthrix]|uniref:Putative Acyl-CoA dehydrogenase n=1 Tax=Candidatus Neomicrothrix parvicella RN1 TaxID=1229780 RepID=R4Z672_9ACTN|nr:MULTISPECIES: acyl-CoA dehydrogenase family protein [Microthrix]NLH67894.1 acyl-CoA/acyl-ACP dehydrogenase [Candidatus Microthrix parvicella]MBK6501706.1 acyl-CoA/acyl-ACP dehydrogenase [Candidatus Microthrix sp.]MBK7019012.1 acyl-CoA/acyl-ACP dehydrogenase [Candidatus Microthrix sp.]MBK7321205.1 acyl-CoA/acyl-ACP dehydrogenase [Candidatus Microthrix sp.]MBL0203379.1 acyl-CoA/acyl-ACP dehydrogenase [Candidatus Microthrix sp.]
MDLLPTDEQAEIASTVASALKASFPMSNRDRYDVIGAQATTLSSSDDRSPLIDASTWTGFGDLGWFSLGLAEAHGGVGYGLAEEVLLAEELGRQVAPGPFVAQIIAARLAAMAGLADAGSLANGTVRAAWGEPSGFTTDTSVAVGHPTTGELLVQHPEGATWVVTISGTDAVLLATSDLTSSGDLAPLDPPTPLRRMRATSVVPGASDSTGATSRWATTLIAAQLAGIAEATCAMSVDYAKERQQFGQPIGSFQAVKHRCADMAARAEAAITQTRWAALTVDDSAQSTGSAAFEVESARVMATRAAVANAEVNIQNHGGIGFTWEHPAHRFVTRARLLELSGGSLADHQAALLAAPVSTS